MTNILEKFKSNKQLTRIVILLILAGGIYIYDNYIDQIPGGSEGNTEPSKKVADVQLGNGAIEQAITNQQSDVQVEAQGKIIKILPDDTQGSQHQRFLVKLDSGNIILIAHNIDLAPRVTDLAEGETISFYGEYEWNNKGGVVHWTHHDPKNWHAHGWIRYRGRTYQ